MATNVHLVIFNFYGIFSFIFSFNSGQRKNTMLNPFRRLDETEAVTLISLVG